MFKMFVTAVDVMEVVKRTVSVGGKCGCHKCAAAAQIAGFELCTVKSRDTADYGNATLGLDISTHAEEFGDVAKTILEEIFYK